MSRPLYSAPEFSLHPDRIVQGDIHAEVLSPTHLRSNYGETIHDDRDPRTEWTMASDIPTGPNYASDQPIVDALFNLAKEEAHRNVEGDGTLRTGAKWSGVWTRDVSYSALLAFAIHNPEAVKASLRAKVKRGRIVQDTGSGGAWPVSSDRTTWVLAAWEVHQVTGERAWLEEIFPIITATLDDDRKTLADPETGLYRGESSFLDWREQTYPRWMDNTDIYESLCLGTNAVHYRAHRIAAEMADLLGQDGEAYRSVAATLKQAINDRLWLLDKGYYGQYLYGRDHMLVSPRFEALGEALCILLDIADAEQAATIMERAPLTPFGVSCIYPQIPDVPPYHNNGVWPFVQGFWNLAAARAGNGAALEHGLAAIYRSAGLYLSNYENLVTESGGVMGTEINSHRMLWSIAANLAMVYRVFMGMEFRVDGLYFSPSVPKGYRGSRTLTDFQYRGATVTISVHGYGQRIKAVKIDGEPVDVAFVGADAVGDVVVDIELENKDFAYDTIHRVQNQASLPTLWAGRVGNVLQWSRVVGAAHYHVYRNEELFCQTSENKYTVDPTVYASYQVAAVDANGQEAFASQPVLVTPEVFVFQAEAYAPAAKVEEKCENYTGKGFIELMLSHNRQVKWTVDVAKGGAYLIDFRFANGSGPVNTDNKCAIRSLTVNDHYTGTVVFPQRGAGDWSKWGHTNAHRVNLPEGKHTILLHFEDWNHNMDGEVNRAFVDYMRLTLVES
ncbi:carbohydrate binding protein with CBM6 domain [Neolewinella xylanilytica]|uniref:Carbohydrate binding protein with CBM6 domain n=1 Tax=Neolewinella xylanilytica TaxID=1514080 RepID=A0A2S6I1V9_9BACT|nr:carbohydrate-binding protein [Neolewinella xylanilytica]PPK85069.1 carbohydrate binding protein with CBM6 domain [Neolewinella xylanilytica]